MNKPSQVSNVATSTGLGEFVEQLDALANALRALGAAEASELIGKAAAIIAAETESDGV